MRRGFLLRLVDLLSKGQSVMAIQLKVVRDTVFKQTTEDVSKLPPEDEVSIAAGTVFDISSWKTLNQTNLRIALFRGFVGNPPRNTWCVNIPDIQLLQPPSIKVIRNTVFKQSTTDSSKLALSDKVAVNAGRVFNLQSWGTASNNHFKLALLWDTIGTPPRNTWYAYAPDIQFVNKQPTVVPVPPPAPDSGDCRLQSNSMCPTKASLTMP